MEALQMETGIDSRTLWSAMKRNVYTWEVKQIQENANIRFGLDTNQSRDCW